MVRIIVSLAAALICSILMTPLFIRIQRKYKIGQRIRQEGPDLHQHKMGTPTMGGLIIFFAIALSLLVYQPEDINVWAAFILLCSFGFVGFIDDFIKSYKGRSLGLKARLKVILQLMICALFLLWFFQNQSVHHRFFIPFFRESFSVPPIIY
ncbi:MAG: phospho-N-acetylmuramoyl-pentapeptide-transferase, partial [Candidatus Atribacteria bacterium]|nr:phospho-N-acetylmuramoyl-pentapeptide-transferase [Candidatus Atribacteria bacterium]